MSDWVECNYCGGLREDEFGMPCVFCSGTGEREWEGYEDEDYDDE